MKDEMRKKSANSAFTIKTDQEINSNDIPMQLPPLSHAFSVDPLKKGPGGKSFEASTSHKKSEETKHIKKMQL